MQENMTDDKKTGREDLKNTKVKTPTEVLKSLQKRMKELEDSMKMFDEKGFNDKSNKNKALHAMQQVLDHLKSGTLESYINAKIFYTTLANFLADVFPPVVVNYLFSGVEKQYITNRN